MRALPSRPRHDFIWGNCVEGFMEHVQHEQNCLEILKSRNPEEHEL